MYIDPLAIVLGLVVLVVFVLLGSRFFPKHERIDMFRYHGRPIDPPASERMTTRCSAGTVASARIHPTADRGRGPFQRGSGWSSSTTSQCASRISNRRCSSFLNVAWSG